MRQHGEQGDRTGLPSGWKKTGWRKKLSNVNKNGIHYCQLKTCTYNSFAAIWRLTAIDKILVAWWKHASCRVARRFWCFLGPKLGLLYLHFYRCYIETITNTRYWEVFPVDWCSCRSLLITDSRPNNLQSIGDLTRDSLPESSTVHHNNMMSSRAHAHKTSQKNVRSVFGKFKQWHHTLAFF